MDPHSTGIASVLANINTVYLFIYISAVPFFKGLLLDSQLLNPFWVWKRLSLSFLESNNEDVLFKSCSKYKR